MCVTFASRKEFSDHQSVANRLQKSCFENHIYTYIHVCICNLASYVFNMYVEYVCTGTRAVATTTTNKWRQQQQQQHRRSDTITPPQSHEFTLYINILYVNKIMMCVWRYFASIYIAMRRPQRRRCKCARMKNPHTHIKWYSDWSFNRRGGCCLAHVTVYVCAIHAYRHLHAQAASFFSWSIVDRCDMLAYLAGLIRRVCVLVCERRGAFAFDVWVCVVICMRLIAHQQFQHTLTNTFDFHFAGEPRRFDIANNDH